MTNQERWLANYEALKTHVLEIGHFCDKHTRLCNWVKFQRKKIKAGTMPEEQMRMFQELEGMMSWEHTGGRRKKID